MHVRLVLYEGICCAMPVVLTQLLLVTLLAVITATPPHRSCGCITFTKRCRITLHKVAGGAGGAGALLREVSSHFEYSGSEGRVGDPGPPGAAPI